VKWNQALAGYVRSLRYIDVPNNNNERGASVLRHFHLVNSFTLGFTNPTSYDVIEQDWEEMPKFFRTSLCSFIQANDIVELNLFNIKNLPMSLLLHFPVLSSLSIHQVHVADSPLPITFPCEEVIPSVSSLNIGDGSLATVWEILGSRKAESCSILDLTQLNELSVQVEDPGAMEIIKYILKTTENIKTVTLQGELILSDLSCSY
jgi:hypothetical protein